ncbi:MAG: hypothetical protein HY518_01045 [Candidatus Aenigmarchaeota archaeon]|nr:hypothetical protein [Candidatus Aenigmarchaeota archaeon]
MMRLEMRVLVCAAVFLAVLSLYTAEVNTVSPAQWWNSSWHYRTGIDINMSGHGRTDWPIEVELNFTALLSQLNRTGTFDENSTRLVEYNSTGNVLLEFTSQFDKRSGYNSTTNAIGTLSFSLNGTNLQGTVRNFFLYFDTIGNGLKPNTTYTTDLEYSWTGQRAQVNNSQFQWDVDTNRGENASGLFRVSGPNSVIFNRPISERAVEYMEYSNATHNLTFDLRGNASFTNGSVRIVVRQEGDEVIFNTTEKTNQTRVTKTYTFYRNSPWIRIEQNMTNMNGSGAIARNSTFGGALAFDAARALGAGCVLFANNLTEPGSWVRGSCSGSNIVAYINVNESGTQNFSADNTSQPSRIGIGLNATQIPASASITETAVIYFNDLTADDNFVEALKNALVNPAVVVTQPLEEWMVGITPGTDFPVYNRGEAVNVTSNANGTFDINDIVVFVNATLDMGTAAPGDDQTIELNDTGISGDRIAGDQLFSRFFNLTAPDVTGEWNLTIREYDTDRNLLNQSSKLFNVTSNYTVSQGMITPVVLVNQIVRAGIIVNTFRNDTGIAGASLNCLYAGSTPVTNITDHNNGTYQINFTANLTTGTYTLNCTATKTGNTGFDIDNFTVENPTTNISVNATPSTFTATQVTQNTSQSLNATVNITNTGNGTGSGSNISLSLPTNWTANATAQSCGNLPSTQSCIRAFSITIANKTVPGNYIVNVTANWTNPDLTLGTNQTQINVTVSSNPQLSVPETLLSDTVGDGLMKTAGNFTVQSEGNDNLTNITFNATGLPNFTITFLPANISTLAAGLNQPVQVNVSVPANFPAGNYSGTINISSSNGGFDTLTLNITVPNSTSVGISIQQSAFNATQITQASGQNTTSVINATNTGNSTARFANITVSSPANITANTTLQSCGNITPGQSCVGIFNVTVVSKTQAGTYIVNYTVLWENLNGTISSALATLSINVSSNPQLSVPEALISGNVTAGTTMTAGNFTAVSAGNDNLTNVTFNVTGLPNFTITFSPANISSLAAGTNQTVLVNATVPANFPSGQYNGTINVTSSNGGFDMLTLGITVPSNSSWTMAPTECTKVESPDAANACNITITNTGNAQITFNITPASGNFTSVNVTSFTVNSSATFIFAVVYNVTGVPKDFYDTIYTVDALNATTTPDNAALAIHLVPFIAPLVSSITLSNNSILQNGTVNITANVTDRSGTGMARVLANITLPNGTNHTIFLNNTLTSGNLSIWDAPYPNATVGNTTQRGNYTLTIFAQDNTNANTTKASSFLVSVGPVVALSALASIYFQGDTGSIFYNIKDFQGNALAGLNVTLSITDSTQNITYNQTFTTNSQGTVSSPPLQPLFIIPSHAPLGTYTLSASTVLNDTITNVTVSNTTSVNFTVQAVTVGGLRASIVTSVAWFPNNLMNFGMVFTEPFGTPVDPDTINLTVYDPDSIIYISANKSTPGMANRSLGFYTFNFTMPVNTKLGAYIGELTITKGSFSTKEPVAFRVSSGNFDLKLTLIDQQVAPSDFLDFFVTIINVGDVGQDVGLDLWVTQQNTTWFSSSEVLFSPSQTNSTITRSAFIFPNQQLGLAALNAKLTMDTIRPPIFANITFDIVQSTQTGTLPTTIITIGGGGGGGGGAGGGGGIQLPTGTRNLEITDYPPEIKSVKGWTSIHPIQVKNTGNAVMQSMYIILTGIPSPWFNIKPESVSVIPPGNVSVFLLELNLPVGATTGDYPLKLTAAGSGNATDSKDILLSVFPTQYELLASEIQKLKKELNRLEIEIDFADKSGKETGNAKELLEQAKEEVRQAEESLDREDFDKTNEHILTAISLVSKINDILVNAQFRLKLEAQIVPLWQIALIILTLVIVNVILIVHIKGMNEKIGRFVKPHILKARELVKTAKGEEEADKAALAAERDKVMRVLSLLEREFKEGLITRNIYNELKGNSEKRLKEIEKRLGR